MTAQKIKTIVTRLGGVVNHPTYMITFPEKFRLKNKKDALDLIDVLNNDIDDEGNQYTVELTEAYNALKIAIKQGVLNEAA